MVTMLTELTYQPMYIHVKSTYKIKVGHKRCVILSIPTPSGCPLTKTTPRRRLSQRRPKYRRPNYRRPDHIYHEKFLCTLDKFDIKLAC